jgi:hypothetical protein
MRGWFVPAYIYISFQVYYQENLDTLKSQELKADIR